MPVPGQSKLKQYRKAKENYDRIAAEQKKKQEKLDEVSERHTMLSTALANNEKVDHLNIPKELEKLTEERKRLIEDLAKVLIDLLRASRELDRAIDAIAI